MFGRSTQRTEASLGREAHDQPLSRGQVRFAIPTWWYAHWLAYVGDTVTLEVLSVPPPADAGRPKKLDTSELLDEFELGIRRELVQDTDFSLVSPALWKLLRTWYSASPPIARDVVERSDGDLEVDVRPRRADVWFANASGEVNPAEPAFRRLLTSGWAMRECRDHLVRDLRKCIGANDAHRLKAHGGRKGQLRVWFRCDCPKDTEAGTSDGPGPKGDDVGASATGDRAEEQTPAATVSPDEWRWDPLLGADDMSVEDIAADYTVICFLVETRSSQNVDFPRNRAWRQTLRVGGTLDARDKHGHWYDSVVLSRTGNQVKIHFKGWGAKFDETKDLLENAMDLVPRFTETKNWRREIAEDDTVEVKHTEDGKSLWWPGKITRLEAEKSKVHLVISKADNSVKLTLDIDSEDLCSLGTHIKDHVAERSRSASPRQLQIQRKSRNHAGALGYGSWRKRNLSGPPLAHGAVGLANLGNTCYMNAVLQCVVHVQSIVHFFSNEGWTGDLNRTNPLGSGGRVAEAFASFLKDYVSDEYSVIVPYEFKKAIGATAVQFQGHGQQDANEFYMLMMDALHEDLNRIKDKPLTSRFDDTDTSVADATIAGEELRRHLLRNDSFVSDISLGQVCPRENVRRKVHLGPCLFTLILCCCGAGLQSLDL